MKILALALFLSAVFAQRSDNVEIFKEDLDAPKLPSGKAESYKTKANNPEQLKLLGLDSLSYNVDDLPMEGYPEIAPWSGSYWGTYLDSINYKWDGPNSLSAVEKYEKAFRITGLKELVNKQVGLGVNWLPKKTCETNADCGKEERCVERNDPSAKVCVPLWYGICHAWAAAAVIEEEPKKPVKVRDVVFEINDIKALVSLMYDYSFKNTIQLLSIGTKCRTAAKDFKMDQFGRPSDPTCRDGNAATVHLALGNMVGLNGKPFFFDKDPSEQVWNQPVAGYKINKMIRITKKVALQLMNTELSNEELKRIERADEDNGPVTHRSPFAPEATNFKYVQTDLYYVKETNPTVYKKNERANETIQLEYILELDDDQTIVGGEWIRKSVVNHPDFLVGVLSQNRDRSMFDGKLQWRKVKQILNASVGKPLLFQLPKRPNIS
jgi:hypothetical protein